MERVGEQNMETLTAAFSDKGGRPHNEDSYQWFLSGKRGVWVVADGLGGMSGGELASGFITQYIKTFAPSLKDFGEETLLVLFNDANKALIEEQEKQKMRNGMRTTAVTAFIENGRIISVHFGDSRFYYFRRGELLFQSRDHSMSQVAVDLGEIDLKDIRFHEDRSRVLKVLGNGEVLQIRTPSYTETVAPGDAFILCTDGFWELIYEEEMTACLQRSATTEDWLANMLDILRSRLDAGSDNYTAVCCIMGNI
jgi:serine/threonine protein phosphatase PrpC